MKRKIIYAMAWLNVLPACAQKQWTLDECISYALENNITLKEADVSRQSAAEDTRQSKATLLPSLSASTNQSVGYRPWQWSGATTVSNGTVNNKVTKTYYNGTYGINASWTVWNGGQNTNQVRLNALNEEQAALSMQQTANSLQEQIAQLFVQILYLREAITVEQQSLQTSIKNEQRGQQMLEVGKMSKADLAQLSAQRSADEYSLVEAKTQLANYKLQLKQLLELTGGQEFDIAAPTTADAQALGDIPSIESVYSQALTLRPEMHYAELSLRQSELQQQIARAGRMPTVSVTGGVGTSTSSNNSNGWGEQMKTNFDASVGLGVSIPIIDQRRTKTAIRKASLQREQALLDQQDRRKQLYQTIENYWLNAQSNQQKFKAAQAAVDSKQQSFDLLSEQFNLGLKNIVELMNGKTSLLEAQQNMLQSKYTTILNIQLLRFYKGEKMSI